MAWTDSTLVLNAPLQVAPGCSMAAQAGRGQLVMAAGLPVPPAPTGRLAWTPRVSTARADC